MLKDWRNRLFKRSMNSYDISFDELLQRQILGGYIVDVRSEQEYAEGHLDGAINIPYYRINENIYNILKDRDNDIVLYCEAGVRSKKAYKKLISLQYKNVYNLYGGLNNWI